MNSSSYICIYDLKPRRIHVLPWLFILGVVSVSAEVAKPFSYGWEAALKETLRRYCADHATTRLPNESNMHIMCTKCPVAYDKT